MIITKRYIHIFIALLLSFAHSSVYSQVPMENVLIEMGTATWSSSCASEVQMINQMKDDGLEISVINYHLNDPYSNQHANQRASFYNIQNLPFPVVAGQETIISDYNSYLENYNVSINTLSSFSIIASGSFIEDTLNLQLSIEKVAAYESSPQLYVVITESNIEVNWQGLTEVNEVERDMSPNGGGQILDFSDESILIFSEKILFDRVWNPENMELTIFIQNQETKDILQCHSQPIANFGPLPVHAFFTVDDTMACVNELIPFQNTSTGDVENTQWYFYQGNPTGSNEYHPITLYTSDGSYNVKLAVSNSISSDTLLIEDFMHIQALPNMTFGPLPEFCHDEEFYQLTEGNPEGGQYFGLFVDTGYFHPQSAGIGNYSLFYSVQNDETGCSDTLEQNAAVFFCELIDENNISKTDFPFLLQRNNHQLQITRITDNYETISEIQLFSITGELIHTEDFITNGEKTYAFSLPLNNHCLIIRVITPKRNYITKYFY